MRTELRTLCAVLVLVFWMGTASAVAPTGTVVAVSGSCSAHGRPLKSGDALQVSDMVDVPTGGHLKLQMADGSVISVGPGSSMTVISYNFGGAGRQAKLSLTQGVCERLSRRLAVPRRSRYRPRLALRRCVPVPPTGSSLRKLARRRSGCWLAPSI